MYGFEIEPLEQEHQAMRSDPYEGTPLSALNIPEKYNFNVVTKQRKSTDELFVPSNAYDIVREGHNENGDVRDVLFKGGVSERYAVLLNQDISNVVRTSIQELDMDVRNMEVKHFFSPETSGCPAGGKWRCNITFKDITIEPKVGDVVAHGVTLYNSYNLTWMYQQLVQAFRLECLNGYSNRETAQSTRKKHTTNISIEGEGQKLANGLEAFYESEGMYQRWMKVSVRPGTADKLFCTTLARVVKPSGITDGVNQTLREHLMREYDGYSGNSLWDVYNVATAWATPLQGRTHKTSWAPQTQRTRHNSVSAMLKSDMWKELEHVSP